MPDIRKTLSYLRGELARVNKVIEVYEAIADDHYQERRRRAVAKAQASGKPSAVSFIPPRTLDPDAMLWLR